MLLDIMDSEKDTERRAEEYRKWKEGETGSSKQNQTYIEPRPQPRSRSGRPEHVMSFADAITNVLFNNYMGFKGRASRSEYWFYTLFTVILGFLTGIVDGVVFGWEFDDPMWFSDILSLALFLPSLAVWIRRLHDVGKSGWWTLIGITIIGLIPLFIWSVSEGDDHPNDYGAVPTNTLERDMNDYTNY